MNQKKIKITVQGTQHDISEESIENTYEANYAMLSDKHIIKYNEYTEEDNAQQTATRNLLKISKDAVHITKKGAINTQMHFEQGKKHYGVYQTPFGNFDMMIETKQLSIQEDADSLSVCITYFLSLNNCPVSKCTIQMNADGIR
ncbi:MAG: DUF1934 domain-containing protein [Butyribacter sp.]|nr:DUF1934 domain-containing protein [bacterium]MDY3854542.1 DUF1934 domain-containing protein [Butyribacter sp.]